MNIETALKEAMTTEGALGVALVDWESGMSPGSLGGGKYLDLEQNMFLYLELDRDKANLALARHNLKRVEGELVV